MKRFDGEWFILFCNCKCGNCNTGDSANGKRDERQNGKATGQGKLGSSLEDLSYLSSHQIDRESRKWKNKSGRIFPLLGELLENFCARKGVLMKVMIL